MKKIKVYSVKTKTVKEVSLPKELSGKVNTKLLAQALRVYEDGEHVGLARARTRGEVARTKRKWFRQKGTGRARHGAQSAPIFVGGGVAHGPKGEHRKLELSRKMRLAALKSAYGLKVDEGKLLVVEKIGSLKKTKEAGEFMRRFLSKGEKYTLLLADENRGVKRVFKNIKDGKIELLRDMNAYKVYFGGLLVIDSEALERKKK